MSQFRKLYSEARAVLRATNYNHPSIVADIAVGRLVEHGEDYFKLLDCFSAVCYALYWRFYPASPDVPKWASERHRAFDLTATESRVWFERPRLP